MLREGRLSRAVLSDDPDRFPRFDREADILQRDDLAAWVDVGQMLDANGGRRFASCAFARRRVVDAAVDRGDHLSARL